MTSSIPRRAFLQRAAVLPAAASLLGPRALGAVGVAPAGAPRGAHLKLSVNAFCFDAALRENLKDPSKGMSLFDALDFCAEQNVDALDPTGYYFPGYPGVPSDKYLNDLKRRAFELGLTFSGTGIRNDFAVGDAAARAADVLRAKQWIEVAAHLGAPVLRVFAGAVPAAPHSWEDGATRMVDALHECVEHGEKYGVIVGLQNHGDMLKTADECLNVLGRIKSRWIGLLLDTGNFLTADPYADIARVIPVTVNWQIKERLLSNKGDPMDLPKLMRIIREANYRGYLPIETLSITGQPYDGRARAAALLERIRNA